MPVAVNYESRQYRTWPWWTVACIICFAVGYLTASFVQQLPRYEFPAANAVSERQEANGVEPAGADEDSEPIEPIAAEAEVPDVADTAKDEAVPVKPVTDTVTSIRFLTTMSRDHYGCMEYWVYIYEANASILGHPDRLKAGTVVTIPSADSLGLRPGDEAKIREAKQKAAEIYGRFN
ncbi:MAG: hypothetical protein K2L33_04925 [Muribaculaceae bacterium]|nr:hypothetical protein [Muribaculaceae bacterium]